MIKPCFFLFLISTFFHLSAQPGSFEKLYLTNGYSDIRGIALGSSGDYLLTGLDKNDSDSSGDMYVMRISAFGETEWVRRYGLPNEDGGNAILLLQDGNYLISGHTNNVANECDAYLQKIDPRGNSLWTKTIGEFHDDEVAFSSVQDQDGSIYMVGRTDGNGSDKLDFLLCKISNEGTLLYKKHFGTPQHDVAFRCIITSDGNLLMAGYTTLELNELNEDIYMVKCTKSGDFLWDKTIDNQGDDQLKTLIEDQGNYFFFGHNHTPDFGIQAYILCTQPNGNTLWEQSYGGIGTDLFNSIQHLPNGDFACFGFSTSYGDSLGDFYKLVVDPTGKLKAMNLYGAAGLDYCVASALNDASCCIMVGQHKQNNGLTNAYLIKTDISNSLGTLSTSTEPEFYMYPNPFHDQLVFTFNGVPKNRSIKFYNSLGQLILKKNSKENINVIYKDEIGIGTFFYSITDEDMRYSLNGKLESY